MTPVQVRPPPNPTETVWFRDPTGLVVPETFMGRVSGLRPPATGWGALVQAIEAGAYDSFLNAGATVVPMGPLEAAPTLLATAARFAPVEVVQALLRRGAHPDVWTGLPDAEERTPATPLRWAVFGARVENARALLDAGADPNLRTPVAGTIDRGDRDMFELLVSRGASCDVMMGDETLLDHALGPSPDAVTEATRAGITARVREILRADPRRTPVPALSMIAEKRKTGGPFSAFARRRLSSGRTWLLFAVAADRLDDRMAAAFAGVNDKVVRGVGAASVPGVDARFLLKLRECAWVWYVYAPDLVPMQLRTADAMGIASRASAELRTEVLAFRGLEVDEYRDGKLAKQHAFGGGTTGPSRRGATRSQEALAAIDSFCQERAARLPDLRGAGDGLDVGLQLVNCPVADVERCDAIIYWPG